MITRDTKLKLENKTYLFIIGEVLTTGATYRHYVYAPTLGQAKDKLKLQLKYNFQMEILEKVGPYRNTTRGGEI